jgi:hypothetical protein
MTRRELPPEWQKVNLAEPLATKSWLAYTAENFINWSQKRSFSTVSGGQTVPLPSARRLLTDNSKSRSGPSVSECQACRY